MELKLDLHVHTASSPDGRMSVGELAAAAREKGLNGAAICDHDVLYRPEADAARAGLPKDFLLIPGEEFSTGYGHILGLFLTKPVETSDVFELIDAIHAQGGLVVLAHPFARTDDEARLAPILPLLDGIEVWNGRANRKNPDANAHAARFAAEHGLPAFAGSDAHLPRELGNGFVTLRLPDPAPASDLARDLDPDSTRDSARDPTPDPDRSPVQAAAQALARDPARLLDAVKAALLEPDNPVGGQNGRHLDVARSQRTKLKKTRAPLRAWAKWLLFAAKCAAEDLKRRNRNVPDR